MGWDRPQGPHGGTAIDCYPLTVLRLSPTESSMRPLRPSLLHVGALVLLAVKRHPMIRVPRHPDLRRVAVTSTCTQVAGPSDHCHGAPVRPRRAVAPALACSGTVTCPAPRGARVRSWAAAPIEANQPVPDQRGGLPFRRFKASASRIRWRVDCDARSSFPSIDRTRSSGFPHDRHRP